MTIIVATDGTDCSRRAVLWAAQEAQRRETPLRIVHIYEWDWAESRYDIGSEYVDVAREVAEGVVANAYRRAHEVAPDVSISSDALTGHTVPRLLELAQGADLLVVGSRGRGGFAGLLLGSVSERMATHAPCPVVVVRGHAGDVEGPVVVGVSDDPQPLEAAFTAAATRRAPLLVVHAYQPEVPLWVTGMAAIALPPETSADRARVEELIEPWRSKFPEVTVHLELTQESAAAALVAASHQARLVVVGTRGHGRVTGALIGSTGLQLLHHSESPVLVVRG